MRDESRNTEAHSPACKDQIHSVQSSLSRSDGASSPRTYSPARQKKPIVILSVRLLFRRRKTIQVTAHRFASWDSAADGSACKQRVKYALCALRLNVDWVECVGRVESAGSVDCDIVRALSLSLCGRVSLPGGFRGGVVGRMSGEPRLKLEQTRAITDAGPMISAICFQNAQ